MKDHAEFYAIYIKEAHPTDGWRSSGNDRAGIKINQAKNFEQRVRAATQCCGALHMTIPLLVDGIDDRVGEAYSGFPDRLYIIDRQGKVAYKGGRGPFG
ncbi:MAG: deiodinase family protein, partial [Pirellulales bacterium]|nr:deiodinase family protein [Pirellulales bacterium]